MKRRLGEKVFQVFDILIMIFILITILFPMLHILSVSVSDREAITTLSVGIIPKGFNMLAYKKIAESNVFNRSLINTIGLTVIGSILSLIVIVTAAYGMSKNFPGKRIVTYYFVITMYFSGGLIPSYLLVSRYLRLNNTYAAYILPALVNTFYIIVVRSQIEAVPQSLIEASLIDGANEYQVLFNIVLPAITPTIAAVGMFISLGKWNMWFPVMLYANKKELWTLQYFLRATVFDKFLASTADITQAAEVDLVPPQNYQSAAIILVALPIVCIYPFIQKYFVKGILVGSVKG
ncbi:MAG TPA: carbohydrate ABC transporter permease [Clostridiaceae bacterium]|jgi:putative aldouronate transport system permease protein|nr:carbohydrate ABC transporter permease [Clostridiaceae bacterium]